MSNVLLSHRLMAKVYELGGTEAQLRLVQPIFRAYHEEELDIGDVDTLADIAEIPDSFWSSSGVSDDNPIAARFSSDIAEIMNTMINAVYFAFDIEPPESTEAGPQPESWQFDAAVATAKRFVLVVS